jgi:hypothetical protein
MKKWILFPLAVVCLWPATALSQDSAKPDAVAQTSLNSKPASTKPKTISGKVGEHGRTILTAKNNLWTIANPYILKEHAGRQVRVKCQISSNAEAKVIQILSVKIIPSEVKSTANPSDAAFRR